MLTPEELSRRVKAARELRGISQPELGDLFEADGLNKTDPGRIERGQVAVRRVHLDAFARHLGVPARWLTDPDLDVVLGLHEPDGEQLRLSEQIEALRDQVRGVALDVEAHDLEAQKRLDAIAQTIQDLRVRRQP